MQLGGDLAQSVSVVKEQQEQSVKKIVAKAESRHQVGAF